MGQQSPGPDRCGVQEDTRTLISHAEYRNLDRSAQFALISAREAWQDAGYTPVSAGTSPVLDPRRVAVVVGCGMGGLSTTLAQQKILDERGARAVSPYAVTMLMPNAPAATVGLAIGSRAGVHTPVSACASGAEALVRAQELITGGHADVVLAGGTEAIINPLAIAGFAAMRALSTRNDEPERASRPWDRGRDGFVMGEGAAMLVLESRDHARARGARVYAELAGAATTADSHHITRPDPHGAEMARAVALALQRAGTTPADLTYWNAHATSTPTGDATELRALREALGPVLDVIASSATKSMSGHLIAAAGALEAALTILAVHHRTAPPTVNLDSPDTDSPLDAVRSTPVGLPPGPALSTSLGFGGHNVALVIRPNTQTVSSREVAR